MSNIQGSHTITIIRESVRIDTVLEEISYGLDFAFNSDGNPISNWASSPRIVEIHARQPNSVGWIPSSEISNIRWSIKVSETKVVPISDISIRDIVEQTTSNGVPALKISGNLFEKLSSVGNLLIVVTFNITINGVETSVSASIPINRITTSSSGHVGQAIPSVRQFTNNQRQSVVDCVLGKGTADPENQMPNTQFTIKVYDWNNGGLREIQKSITRKGGNILSFVITDQEVGVSEPFLVKFFVNNKEVTSDTFEIYDTTDPYMITFSDVPSSTIQYGQSVTTSVSIVQSSDHSSIVSIPATYSLTYRFKDGDTYKTLVTSNSKNITLSPAHYNKYPNITSAELIAEITY